MLWSLDGMDDVPHFLRSKECSHRSAIDHLVMDEFHSSNTCISGVTLLEGQEDEFIRHGVRAERYTFYFSFKTKTLLLSPYG